MAKWIGIDYFQTAPNAHDNLQCRACRATMDIRRSVMVQTGPYHPKSLRDTFSCPHSGTPNHDLKVKRVRKGIDEAMY
jgi:hypothetical protein